MGNSTYFKIIIWILKHVTHSMETTWETPYDGQPAIFACNHARAFGPIAMTVHFDLAKSSCSWINHQMMQAKMVPSYIRKDFWWKQGMWYTHIFDYTLPYIVALVIPPLFRGSGGIPVYHDMRVMQTFRESAEKLKSGKNIIIFPEKPVGYNEYSKELSTGFTSIARHLLREGCKPPKFYPVHIDWKRKKITVGSPVSYDPNLPVKEESIAIVSKLARTVNGSANDSASKKQLPV
ncbi:MAG: hypothetical protein RR058_04395 [Oscillospiraceae bacterium]